MSNTIRVALPKGRLAEETLELFIKKGICRDDVVDFDSRKLIFTDEENDYKFLLIRNTDIPAYVGIWGWLILVLQEKMCLQKAKALFMSLWI